MLRLHELQVSQGDFRLGPLNATFSAGERVAYVGPNGAGKSTTLKAIAGLIPDYTGSVVFGGEELRTLRPEVRTRIGYLPEELRGYGWMTIREHLAFLRPFYSTWDQEYARHLLDRLHLKESGKVGTLSKGMKVKLSFVAAEAYRPPTLLLDEPTSGLDPLMREEVLALIEEYFPSGGDRLVIFSTHILEDVEGTADRVLLLRAGKLILDETAETVRLRNPGISLARSIVDVLSDKN